VMDNLSVHEVGVGCPTITIRAITVGGTKV
jgi:hypothetical protein